MSQCGSSVGTGLVSRLRDRLTTEAGRDYRHRRTEEGTRKGGGYRDERQKGRDVSGYQRIVAYDRSLFPSIFLLASLHSMVLSSNSVYRLFLSFAPSLFYLALAASSAIFRRSFSASPSSSLASCCVQMLPPSRKPLPPSCPPLLSLSFLQSPLHSSPLEPSTRLPNTAISALSPLRHFNYEMINS